MHFMSLNYIVPLLIIVFSNLICSLPILSSQTFPIAKRSCNDTCGNVSIPFPFGMTEDCYLDESYFITCTNSSNDGPRPFTGNIPVRDILLEGQLVVLLRIVKVCYHPNGTDDFDHSQYQSLELSSFVTVNSTANKLVAVGCDTSAIAKGRRGTRPYTTGCMSICSDIEDVDDLCSGSGCCELSIASGIRELRMTLSSYYNHTNVSYFNPCSYAFVIEKRDWNSSPALEVNQDHLFKKFSRGLIKVGEVIRSPAILDWSIENITCEEAVKNSTSYACKENTDCDDVDGLGYRCQCIPGYEGNPYLPGGCRDIDECKDNKSCGDNSICSNTPAGSYTCTCSKGFHKDQKNGKDCIADQTKAENHYWMFLGIAISVGFLFLASCYSYFEFKRRKSIRMKEKFFRENGGLLLQQQLCGKEGSSKTARIFTAEELKKATNNFHESRIIGQGGYGRVYKGFLLDNSTVAIKKSKIVSGNQIEQFINEVVVLSQINHRNVVQLLGCCLETEVPLLVYEFINNGTLYQHIHDKSKSSGLSWGTRLRIATETAGVLSYLHSAANPPIIHRDVKSANILLDGNCNAKVSDFGTSRLVPLNEMQLSTIVQGTLGYLDPEYLQTSQLTEKSDVYSFGVVLVELLTGKQVLSSDRPDEERSLAQYFLSSLKADRFLQILDHNIVRESNIQQLKEVAMLAKRCLNVKGEDRPLMKEVGMELESLRVETQHFHVALEVESTEREAFIEQQSDTFASCDSSGLFVGYHSILDDILSPGAGGR